jgi:hypothetical protein
VFLEVMAVTLSCVVFVLMWGIVFVCSQRLFLGEIVVPQRLQRNRPAWGFLNYVENEHRAQSYLLRVVALTNAIEVGDGCYRLYAGTSTFHVRDRYVTRLREGKDAKSRYERTCFFVPNQGMPIAELIATALLMLKNDPTLFDKWAVKNGESFKADGQIFN